MLFIIQWFLVMILSITGEILQFMLFFNYYVSFP